MIHAQTGVPFEAVVSGATPGLVGQMTVQVYDPSDASVIVAPATTGITEPASGTYRVQLTVSVGGTFMLRWTEPSGATAEEELVVGEQAPTLPTLPTPLSVAELKARMDIQLDASDDVLEGYLLAALAQAQEPPPFGCGRLLVPDPPEPTDDPVTRTTTLRGLRRHVPVPDARDIVEVKVDGAVTTDYDTLERDGHVVRISLPRVAPTYDADGLRTESDPRTVTVMGRFGFLDLPENLKDAIYALAARMHYEAGAMYADQVATAEGLGVQSYYRQLPPRTKLAFASFALPTGLVGLS